MLTSIGCVETSSLILKMIFSCGSDCRRDRNSAEMFILPEMCAVVKLNLKRESHAVQKGGGNIFVWKNCVIDLLSVIIKTGFGALQKICPNILPEIRTRK